MKKLLYTILTIAALAMLPCVTANAAHQLSGAGDIILDVQNELGQSLNGATVDLQLPGPDGVLDAGTDVVITHIDGTNVGLNADGDGLGATDGDAEFSSSSPSASFGGNITNGQQFKLKVSFPGYVDWAQTYVWNSASTNSLASTILFTVKVVMKEQLGNSVTGGTAAISGITGGLTAVDGGANDSDSTANGTIYVAQQPAEASPATVTMTAAGFLTEADSSQTINSLSQSIYNVAFDYPFVITAQDELNAPMTLTAANATITGLTPTMLRDNGGTLYLAATGGPASILLTYSGFITSTTAGAYTFNAAGVQQTVTFQAAGSGPALTYALHVIGSTDELGNIIALTGSPLTATGFTINSQTINGGISYVAATPAAGTLSLSYDGYVSASIAVTPNTTAMQTVDFDSAAQYAATIDGPPLMFPYKITGITTEALAADITGTVTGLTCGDDTGQNTCSLSAGAWYCPVLLANSNGTIVCAPTLDGYVQANYTLGTGTTRTAYSDPQRTDTVPNVKYAQKYTLTNEAFSSVHTGSTVTITGGTGSCTESGGTGVYYCNYTFGTDGGAISNVLDGYVNDSGTNTSQNRAANTDAQDAKSITVKYSHKVTTISTQVLATNIAGTSTTLTIGGTACTWDAGTSAYYCPTPIGSDNAAVSANVTSDGYVQQNYGTVGNRAAHTDAQSVDAVTGVVYSHRITTINTEVLATNIAGAAVSVSINGTVCTWDAGGTTSYYCPVPVANDDNPTSAAVTADGYVQQNYGTVNNRGAQTDAQQTDTITSVKYSHKVTTITTETLNASLVGAATSLTLGGTACTYDVGSTAYYCPVPLASDDSATSASVTRDGYVQGNYGTVTNRTAQSDAQASDVIANVQYAQKYTLTNEAVASIHTGAAVSIVGGTGSCTESAGTGVYYCNYTIGTDGGGIANVLDGYVNDQAANISTNRAANTDAQDARSITVKFSHKVTTISTQALATNIAGTSTTLTIGGTTCNWHAGTSTYYCAVTLAADDVAMSAAVTLDGYVQASYGNVGNRAAHTDAQQTDTISNVQYSHRILSITTEAVGTQLAGTAAVSIGGTGCTWHAGTTAYYCAVPIAADDTASSAAVTLDGYVQQNYSTVNNRNAHIDPQQTDAITNVQYAHRVTSITTEVLNANITGSVTALSLGGTACTLNGGVWYCPVPFASDDTANSATVTLDGYVQMASYGTVSNRSSISDPQQTDTIANVLYAQKYTLKNEVFNTVHTGAVVSVVGGTGSCTESAGAGVYYCNYTAGTDGGGISNVLDGYVDDQATNSSSNRALATDAQDAKNITVKFSHKITTVTTEAIGTNIAGSGTSVTINATACTWDSGSSAYYCPVPLAGDDVATSVTVTADGYVQAANYGSVANRAAHTTGQQTDTIANVRYSHRVNTISSENILTNIAGATTGLSIGGNGCTWHAGTTAYYCAVLLANDNTATSATVTMDGYVETAYGTVNNRAAHTDAQAVDAIASVQYSHKITTIQTEALAANIAGAGTTVTIGGDTCTWHAGTSAYYCNVLVANDNAGTANVTLNGYVSSAYGTVNNRAAVSDPQQTDTITSVLYAQKYTLTAEAFGTAHSGSTVTVVGGTGSCTESGTTGIYYCNYTTGTDGGGISNVLDGYVNDQATNISTNRAADTDAQDARTISVKYSHKVTSITTQAIGTNIAASGTSLTINATTCTWYAGTSSYYCPVPIAGDNTANSATVSADGYVEAAYGTVGNRLAHTDAQSVDPITPILYSHRINNVNTEVLATNIAATATTVMIGATACTWEPGTSAYYCAVPVASDETPAGAYVSADGYVQSSAYGTIGNRAAQTDGQSVDTITGVLYSHKITTVNTEVLNTNIYADATGISIGATACAWGGLGNGWYCAVPLLGDDTPGSVTINANGYVQLTTYGSVGNRAAQTDTQSVDTISNVLYAQKYTLVTEAFTAVHTGSTVTINGGTGSCTESGATGVYYCTYTAATDGGGISNVLDGYVDDQATNISTNRAASTDAQDARTITVKYAQKYTLTNEAFATAHTGAAVTVTGGTGSCTESGTTGIYYCNYTIGTDGGAISNVKDGYVDASGTNTSANRAGHTAAQDAQSLTVEYSHIITNVETQYAGTNIAGATPTITIGGDSCTWHAGTTAYYCPVLLANDDTSVGATVTMDGYVQQAYGTVNDRTANTDAQVTDTIIDIVHAYRITAVNTEAAQDIKADLGSLTCGDDTAHNTCEWGGGVAGWLCPVTLANSNGTMGCYVALNGYITATYTMTTGTTRAANTTAQVSDTVSGVQYTIKLSSAQDEFGNTVTLGGTETAALYSDAACTLAAAAPVAGPLFATGTWYIAQAPGTYYAGLAKTGYVNACDSASIVAAAAGPQAVAAFASATNDSLKYALKVAVYDQSSPSTPLTGVTATFGGAAPTVSSQGGEANVYAWAANPVAGQLLLNRAGFVPVDSGAAQVTPGGGATAQTSIRLSGYTAGNDLTDVVPVAGGSTVNVNGMYAQSNVQITVQQYPNTAITGLSTSTFEFLTATGSAVTPYYFEEIGAGVYEMKVSLETNSLQIKNVSTTVDLEDSSVINLAGLNNNLTSYGTVVLAIKPDHLEITAADGTLTADGVDTEVLTATLYDSNGAAITAGHYATTSVTFTLSGGSVTPPSTKDISATTLGSATSIAGGGTTTVTGQLVAGVGTIDIIESYTGTITVSLSATGTASFQQENASNTLSVNVTAEPGAATQIIAKQTTTYTTSVDNTESLRFEFQDALGNIVETADTFTLLISGTGANTPYFSAVTTGTATGTVGAGVTSLGVQAASGVVVVSFNDHASETVSISIDPLSAGLPACGGATCRTINFRYGEPKQVVLIAPAPASLAAGATSTITAQVLDQYSNLVATGTNSFTLNTTGSAKFTAMTAGTLTSSLNQNTITGSAAAGLMTVSLVDSLAETVTLSISGTSAPITINTSTQSVTFTPGAGNKLVFVDASGVQVSNVEQQAGATTSYRIIVQDSFGNPLGALGSAANIDLSTTSTAGTGHFRSSATSTTDIATITIPATDDEVNAFYVDTTAGSYTLTADGSAYGYATATITTVVYPAAPVMLTYVTETGPTQASSTQPLGLSNTQTAANTNGAIIIYPYTQADSISNMISANGTSTGKIVVTARDVFGNILTDALISITNVTIPSGFSATLSSSTSGVATYDVVSSAAGTATLQIRVSTTRYGATDYGYPFSIYYKVNDTTPPTIGITGSSYSLVNGDRIGSQDPLIIYAQINDPGTLNTGVNISGITITVRDSLGTAMPDTGSTSCALVTIPSGVPSTSCASASNCTLCWTPSAALPAGSYSVTLSVPDNNGNTATQTWTVYVSGGSNVDHVAAGAPGNGIFNPLGGGNMSISFQSPGAGIVSLEVYRRDGRLVYSTASTVAAGYNEILWDGRGLSGSNLANGIYVFRLRGNLTTGAFEQTGKLAIYKK